MYYIANTIITDSLQTGEGEEILAFIISIGMMALGCVLLLLFADKGNKKEIKKGASKN